MKDIAEYLFLSHSYNYKNFIESVSKYTFTIGNKDKYIVFCRMTLIVIEHNLSKNQWRELCLYLSDMIRAKFNIKQLNDLDEYKTLRTYVEKVYCGIDIKVIKRESPDFEILMPDNTKIGIEVTKFVNETDAVVYKIASENFGKGKSAEEIEEHAKGKYRNKSKDITIRTLSDKDKVAYISKKKLTNVTCEHYENAQKILEKYYKFRKWATKEHFDSKIILCVAYSPINFTKELDLVEISNNLFNNSFDIDCKVVIFSLYDGLNGFWGMVDLKNKQYSYYSENNN